MENIIFDFINFNWIHILLFHFILQSELRRHSDGWTWSVLVQIRINWNFVCLQNHTTQSTIHILFIYWIIEIVELLHYNSYSNFQLRFFFSNRSWTSIGVRGKICAHISSSVDREVWLIYQSLYGLRSYRMRGKTVFIRFTVLFVFT